MSIIPSGLPFDQSLMLVAVQGILPILFLPLSFWMMMRYMPIIMDSMHKFVKGLEKTERDYTCNCSRCQFQLRTKRGLNEWKRYIKRERKYNREDLI
jgi:hypothetical protein